MLELIQHSQEKKDHQLEMEREKRMKEKICVFLFICEFTEKLAFVQRKTFHVSAA